MWKNGGGARGKHAAREGGRVVRVSEQMIERAHARMRKNVRQRGQRREEESETEKGQARGRERDRERTGERKGGTERDERGRDGAHA